MAGGRREQASLTAVSKTAEASAWMKALERGQTNDF
jgi:hypothetical protein